MLPDFRLSFLAGAILILSACNAGAPRERASMTLPDDLGTVHVDVWPSITSEGSYHLVVENSQDAKAVFMWDDWGPAQRVSLYLTPDRELVAIGGGGLVFAYGIDPERGPRQIDMVPNDVDSSTWTYLGAFDRVGFEGEAEFRFLSPTEQRECHALFGMGGGSFRAEYGAEHFCDDLDI